VSGRPRQRLGDVSSRLEGFVITSFDVDPARLREHVDPSVEIETCTIGGRERALVSAVSFLNTRFFVGFAPFVKLSCGQTNYRAYGRRDGKRCVWFFGTGLDSIFVAMPRHLWRLPWHRMRVTREGSWDGDRLRSYGWHARADGAEERLVFEGTGEPLGVLPGFETAEETREVLTHPLVGYLWTRGGRLVTYGVWHEELVMEVARVKEARYERFERLGLVAPGQPPHSVLVQRLTDFLVLLPPRRA